MLPSPQQEAIFQDVASGEGHTVVQARAGCGKTTTIVAALDHIPRGEDALLVAFNKSIAAELKERVRVPRVEISTLHSYGLRQLTRALGRCEIDADKMKKILKRWEVRDKEVAAASLSLASRAKGELVSKPEALDELLDEAGLEVPDYPGARERVVDFATRLLETSAEEQATIDFDDMIWYPNIFQMGFTRFDRVFVDERQDLNRAQLKLTLKACVAGGRIVAVGDDAQAIYGFRGAGGGTAEAMAERLGGAKTLPLSVTYRCPKSVVEKVRHLVPDFTAHADAPEGKVESCSGGRMLDGVREGDFVLSRANAPLLGVCFELLKRNVRANIAGRDIGAKLKATVNRARTEDVTQLLKKVDAWSEREIARLNELERSSALVHDTAECIHVLAEGCERVEDIRQKIDTLFAEKGGGVVCSSTHKAKGLERERVWMLRDTYRPSEGGEEANLFYVAATRAKSELYLVRTKESGE